MMRAAQLNFDTDRPDVFGESHRALPRSNPGVALSSGAMIFEPTKPDP